MLSSFFGGQEERRRDPEDGQWRTYKELQQVCKGKYPEQEIQQYWETSMFKEGMAPGDLPERQMVNVVSDPFMTAGAARREQRAQAQSPSDTSPSPFVTAPGQSSGLPDRYPPPQQSEDFLASQREQMYEEMVKARRHWTEVAARMMGPGDPERKNTVRNILVVAPWLLFMWVLLLWVLLRHYSADCCVVLTALLAIASAAMILLWVMGKRFGQVSLLALGSLCLLAVVAATVVGSLGWHTYWRQYWWLQTGYRSEGNSALTAALGLSDSSIIGFWNDTTKRTINNTYVDSYMSAGYKDKHYYCVAPILSPRAIEGTITRVNFWAVGLDCCQRSGSFFCDDSRRSDAGYGVVMLDDGFPCPDCHEQKFRAAVEKAEAIHNLVSAPGAIMVRWVRNPMATELGMLWKAVLFIVLSGILSFSVLGVLGVLLWYYGIGKRSLFESVDDGSRQKLLA